MKPNNEAVLREAAQAMLGEYRTVVNSAYCQCDEAEDITSNLVKALAATATVEMTEHEAGRIMQSAHALCPSDLSHPEKMRWIAKHFIEKSGAATVAKDGGLLLSIEAITPKPPTGSAFCDEWRKGYNMGFISAKHDALAVVAATVDAPKSYSLDWSAVQPLIGRGSAVVTRLYNEAPSLTDSVEAGDVIQSLSNYLVKLLHPHNLTAPKPVASAEQPAGGLSAAQIHSIKLQVKDCSHLDGCCREDIFARLAAPISEDARPVPATGSIGDDAEFRDLMNRFIANEDFKAREIYLEIVAYFDTRAAASRNADDLINIGSMKYQGRTVTDWVIAAKAASRNAGVVDNRRCKKCASIRGGDTCWKCGSETFTPDPRCGDEPALPPIDRIRELAKEVGYAIGVHGSQQRDFDVIAAPWTDMAIGNHALLEHIAAGLKTDNGPARIISTERKPLGRYAATIQMDGWYKQLDISVCPNEQYERLATTAPDTSARDAALEEAAQACVGIECWEQSDYGSGYDSGAQACAGAIRALKIVPGEPT